MSTLSDRAYQLGFSSLETELSDRRLPVSGTIPSWLSGTLIRNGPGKFDIGGERVNHWFDGLAMLRRYGFDDGDLYYSNRFLRTDAYEDAQRGRTAGEFGTDTGTFRRLARWIRAAGPPTPTDNACVHVVRLGDHYVALTEAPRRIAFDPRTLETVGEFRWTDSLTEHLASAHLTVDPVRGETIGHATAFGRPHQYHVYRIPDGTAARDRIASVTARGPGYVHDCAVTPDYVVLVESPLRIALWRILAPGEGGLLDALTWEDDRPTRVIAIERDTGETSIVETDPFFVFHHVNAFEADGEIVLDLVAFEDDAIVTALSMAELSSGGFAGAPNGRLVRLRIDPVNRSLLERSVRYVGGLELPTVQPAFRCQPYRYAYAQATDRTGGNGLVKIDVESGTSTEWWERGIYVEEPRSVRRPDSDAEDDGVVIAPALDTNEGRSTVLVFDAATLTELARAPLPHPVPFGFHGRYFPEVPGAP